MRDFIFRPFYQKDVWGLYSKFRNTLKLGAIGALAATMLAQSGAAFAAGDATGSATNATYDIVVLGDSLAAGYQKGFTEKSVPYGFAEHVFEQALFRGLRAEYVNYGVIGLKTDGLSNWLEAAVAGEAVTESDVQTGLPDPRAASIFEEMTKTLTSDISNAETVLIGTTTDVGALQAAEKAALQSKLDALIDNYAAKLDGILDGIAKLQPKAEIIIGNQYLPLPTVKLNGNTTYLKVAQATALFLKDGQTKLNERLSALVKERAGQGLVIQVSDAAKAIENNIMTFTSIKEGDIHPTALGYTALGKAYAEQLWGDYKTVQPRAAGVPISVVVNGKEVLSQSAPFIKNDRTYLAVRDITDAMGAQLAWDAKTSTASITLGGRTVDITVGAKSIRVDGKTVPLKAEPAYLQPFPAANGKPPESKTYLPLAALSEGLGFQVEYRHEKRIAFING
jgi:lysophospholipase L1-like esterase